MAERTHNPSSTTCIQWEMLLADALDGLLKPEDQALFSAHKSVAAASGSNSSPRNRRSPPACSTKFSPKPVRAKLKATA